MYYNPDEYAAMPLGIVLRRSPGVTRWAAWSWSAVAVLPGAGPADWKELRREGDVAEFHAATVTLQLHGAETEAYAHGLGAERPGIYVIMRPTGEDVRPFEPVVATASPYEAQQYTDSAEETIWNVPMPPALRAWVEEFVDRFHEEEPFKKRRRRNDPVDMVEDGRGDSRIRQMWDVYRAPTGARTGAGHVSGDDMEEEGRE